MPSLPKMLGLKNGLEGLSAVSYEPVDVAVVRQGMASLRDLPRLMEFGSLEERREFLRAFVTGVTVFPEERRIEIRTRKIPASILPKPGSSVGLVAGARYEPVQKNLVVRSIPLEGDLLAGLRAA